MGMLHDELMAASRRAREKAVNSYADRAAGQRSRAAADVVWKQMMSLGNDREHPLDTAEKSVSNHSRDTAP